MYSTKKTVETLSRHQDTLTTIWREVRDLQQALRGDVALCDVRHALDAQLEVLKDAIAKLNIRGYGVALDHVNALGAVIKDVGARCELGATEPDAKCELCGSEVVTLAQVKNTEHGRKEYWDCKDCNHTTVLHRGLA